MDITYSVLTLAPMPAVVQSALALDGHRDEIAARDELDPAVWWELARSKPQLQSGAMCALARRDLDDEQLTWLFANERRSGPLEMAVHRNGDRITAEHVASARKLPAAVARLLAPLDHLPDDLRLSLALAAGKGEAAVMLAGDIVPGRVDDRVADVLLDAASWWPNRPNRKVYAAVATLVELSPSVSDRLLADVDDVPAVLLTALASSHTLDGDGAERLARRIAERARAGSDAVYAALAFIANPKVPVEVAATVAEQSGYKAADALASRRTRRGTRHLAGPVAECDDVDLLAWAAYRALPSEYRPAGKPWYLPAVVTAPAFDELPGRIHQQVNNWDFPLPTEVARVVHAALGADPDTVTDRTTHHRPSTPTGHDHATTWPEPGTGETVEVDLGQVRLTDVARSQNARRRAVLAAVAERLGDDPGAWRTFLSLADSSPITVDDLLCMVDATR